MAWTVTVAKPAQKQTARFPAKGQQKIGAAVRSMADDPIGGDVLKLEGGGSLWRRRAGSYRIFFTVDTTAKTVAVTAILRRTSSTYQGNPALRENLTKWAYYTAFPILRTARSSRLLTASRLALSSR